MKIKLNANVRFLKGSGVMVDDPLCGTTSSKLIELVKRAGAAEVHQCSPQCATPALDDTTERETLIASRLTWRDPGARGCRFLHSSGVCGEL